MSQLKPRECQEERTELMLTIRISQKEKPEVLSCPLNHDKAFEMGRRRSTHWMLLSRRQEQTKGLRVERAGFGGGKPSFKLFTPTIRFPVKAYHRRTVRVGQ